jgi:hypothetical protein
MTGGVRTGSQWQVRVRIGSQRHADLMTLHGGAISSGL